MQTKRTWSVRPMWSLRAAGELRRTRAAGVRSWRGDAVAHHRTSTVAVHRAQTSERTRRHHFIRGNAE